MLIAFVLVGMIINVEFLPCPREVNEVVHGIVKFVYVNDVSCNWVDEPPDFVVSTLVNDVTILPNQ